MEISGVASGGLVPLVQRQGGPAVATVQTPAPPAPANGDSRMARDLGAVLDELGLSPQGDGREVRGNSIRDSLEAFINTLMGALQQQEQQLALQQQQRQALQEERKVAQADGAENPLKRDLEHLLAGLEQPREQDEESAVRPLQSQLTRLLESSGAAESGVTLKEVLSGLVSKLPSEPAERKGYRVDTLV